VYAEAISHTL